MSTEDTPGEVRSSEGLGPLPEPHKKVRIVEDADYPVDLRLYAPEQMRAYAAQEVAAERERCAKTAEAQYVLESLDAKDGHPCDIAYNQALHDAAIAIRHGA